MKKTSLILLVVLSTMFIFAFVASPNDDKEIKITVTAEKQTKFDMSHNGTTTKGLKTPYEFTITTSDDSFIFKANNLKSNLKVKAERPNKGWVIGEWPIVVIVINNDKISTFGLE